MEFWLHSAETGLLSMSLAACSNISFQTKFKLYKVIKSTKTQKKEVLAVGVLEFSVVETSMSHRRMEVSTLVLLVLSKFFEHEHFELWSL